MSARWTPWRIHSWEGEGPNWNFIVCRDSPAFSALFENTGHVMTPTSIRPGQSFRVKEKLDLPGFRNCAQMPGARLLDNWSRNPDYIGEWVLFSCKWISWSQLWAAQNSLPTINIAATPLKRFSEESGVPLKQTPHRNTKWQERPLRSSAILSEVRESES